MIEGDRFRAAQTNPKAVGLGSSSDNYDFSQRQLAGVVIEPRSLLAFNRVKAIIELVAIVHPVADAVTQPKFEREEIAFVNN